MIEEADATATDADASSESSKRLQLRMPKLICFDLDYTLWPLWWADVADMRSHWKLTARCHFLCRVDTHVTPPLKRRGKSDVNEIYDRHGQKMAFYKDVPAIIAKLKEASDIHVAIASRTHAPRA